MKFHYFLRSIKKKISKFNCIFFEVQKGIEVQFLNKTVKSNSKLKILIEIIFY